MLLWKLLSYFVTYRWMTNSDTLQLLIRVNIKWYDIMNNLLTLFMGTKHFSITKCYNLALIQPHQKGNTTDRLIYYLFLLFWCYDPTSNNVKKEILLILRFDQVMIKNEVLIRSQNLVNKTSDKQHMTYYTLPLFI